jgi:hypothetical protein
MKSKKESHAPVKQFEHAEPTVIHHYEDDQTVLERWMWLALDKGRAFWLKIAGGVILVALAALLLGRLRAGDPAVAESWKEVLLATSADEQRKIVDEFPDTKAALWTKLRLAEEQVNRAFIQMPASRDEALPLLKRASDLFVEVQEDSHDDPTLQMLATYGHARALEARNDLKRARDEYAKVAETWPDTEQGKKSAELVKILDDPDTIAFYKQLYEFKPTEMTLDPAGRGTFNLPTGHPPLDGPTIPVPGLNDLIKKETAVPPAPTPEGSRAAGSADLPLDVFKPGADSSKPEDKKIDIKPKFDSKKSDLPDVFPDAPVNTPAKAVDPAPKAGDSKAAAAGAAPNPK